MNRTIYKNRTINSRWTRMLTFVVALVTCCVMSYNVSAQNVLTQNFDGTWTTPPSLTPAWSGSTTPANAVWHKASYTTGWSFTSGGAYSPAGALSTSSSARFHSYGYSSGTGDIITPTMDFSPSGPKQLTFYYINPSGTDVLNVYLSTDNGATYGSTLQTKTTSSSWTLVTVALGSSTSSTVKIKFTGTTDYGNDDIGIDQLSVDVLNPCTTPAPGNTISSAASVCSGVNFTLSLQNSTPGTGVTYLWQSADDNLFTINAANLGTASTQVTNQTGAKYYRCQVTCSTGPSTVASNPVNVTMQTPAACTVYCVGTASCTGGDHVTSVNFNSGAINNASGACLGSGGNSAYSDYRTTVAPPTVQSGSTYPITVTVANGGTEYAAAWIDYNQSGTFDAGEYTDLGVGVLTTPWTFNANISIPGGATSGNTVMRIRSRYNSTITSGDACTAFSYGETEDYMINIQPPPPCAGSPTPGNTITSSSSVCSGGSVNLSLQNATPGTGVTYAWWADYGLGYNPTGVTTATFTTPALTANASFFCQVTCASGPGLYGMSTPVTITIVSPPVGGTASGPSTGLTYQNLAYSVTGTTGSLQWQYSTTAIGGPYTDIPAATTASLNITANGAGTYYVRCKAFNAGCTDDFSTVITTVVTVAGDNVCNALPLSVGLNGPYTNVGATTEVGEAQAPNTSCTGQTGWCTGTSGLISNSVWYSFVAPASGNVSIHFITPSWDSQIALWSASSCGDLLTGNGTLLAANDDSSSSPFHAWIAPKCLIPGNTYYVQVDGYGTTTNNNFSLLLVQEASILPTASISGSAEICSPASTNLTINFTGTAPWTYSINGGAPQSTSNNPETVSVAPGSTTTYTLTSLGDNSCPGGSGIVSGSATVTVSSAPPAGSCTITTMPVNGCVGNVVSVSTTVSPGATGYNWSVPTGTLINGVPGPLTTVSNTVNITLGPIPANASGWEVCAFASNACGNTNTNCKYIRGTLSTPAPISGSVIACPSTGPDNYSTTAVSGATSYLWTITGDASVSGTGTTAAVSFGPSFTSGTLCVRALLPCGYQSAQRCLTINNATPVLGVMSGTFTVCPGTLGVAYSVPPAAGANLYTWTLPAGATIASGSGTNSITVDFGPTYNGGNVCVTGTSVCNIVSASRCKTVTSNKPNTPGNFTSGALSGVCGQTITYTIAAVAGATSYTWTAPSGASLATPNGNNSIDVTYTNGFTTGNLCVTANNGCGSSAPRCVLIKGTPLTPGAISGSAVVCANASGVAYSVTPVAGATSYLWATPAGTTIVSGQGTSSIVLDWGANGGVVSVTASGACGSSGTRTLSVLMNCKVSGSVTPGTEISAYPNPVSNILNVDVNSISNGVYTIELMDLSGRVIYATTMNTIAGMNSNQVDVSNYAKGMYMLSVKNSEGFAKQIRVGVE